MTNVQHLLHSELVGAEELLGLFKLSPSVPDGDCLFEIKQGGMQFQDISFSYNNHSDILRKINFTVRPGEKIALVVRNAGPPSLFIPLNTQNKGQSAWSNCSLGRPQKWKANTIL